MWPAALTAGVAAGVGGDWLRWLERWGWEAPPSPARAAERSKAEEISGAPNYSL